MLKIDSDVLRAADKKLVERYSQRFEKFGNDPRSLGWDTKDNQRVRYRTATDSVDLAGRSILDVGCGLADFHDYIQERRIPIKSYSGMDIIPDFVESCRTHYSSQEFFLGNLLLDAPPPDSYDTVCMFGLLNFRFSDFDNRIFAEEMINSAFQVARHSVIVDMLSANVDVSYPKEDFVFYYNPTEMLDFSLSLTPHVQLRHDYESIPQREFTLVLKKAL